MTIFILIATLIYGCSPILSSEIIIYSTKIELTNENSYNNIYAKIIKGKREVRKTYSHGYVIVDIETNHYVIEGGLDNKSSLDSIQQALFLSHITNKKPMIIIYDTDGKEGKYEYQIKKACNLIGIDYRNIRFINY